MVQAGQNVDESLYARFAYTKFLGFLQASKTLSFATRFYKIQHKKC